MGWALDENKTLINDTDVDDARDYKNKGHIYILARFISLPRVHIQSNYVQAMSGLMTYLRELLFVSEMHTSRVYEISASHSQQL
jgi:hypothetical protein